MQAPFAAPAPPPFVRRWTPRRVILATIAVVAVLAGFYLVDRFSSVFFVLFIAAVLATAMRPAVLWLARFHIPQWGAVLLIYAILTGITAGVLAVLVPLIVNQGSSVLKDVPTYYTHLRGQLGESHSLLLRRVAVNLPPSPQPNRLGRTPQPQ